MQNLVSFNLISDQSSKLHLFGSVDMPISLAALENKLTQCKKSTAFSSVSCQFFASQLIMIINLSKSSTVISRKVSELTKAASVLMQSCLKVFEKCPVQCSEEVEGEV
jgi:altronate dehydratase